MGLNKIFLAAWLMPAMTCPCLQARAAAPPAKERALENDRLSVWLDPAFPRIFRYVDKTLGATFYGARENSPRLLEVNRVCFHAPGEIPFQPERAYHLSTRFADDSAVYSFRLWQPEGSLSFEIRFHLEGPVLQMRLLNVVEAGAFRLQSLYFPDHSLLTVRSAQTQASACRVGFSRNDRGIIRLDGVFRGPVGEMGLDAGPAPTHWALVHTDRAVGLIGNNIPVFPLQTRSRGSTGAPEEASLWNGLYHYRVQGRTMPLLDCSVRFLGDLNADGQTDWMDGAFWLRGQLPESPPAYRGAFIYKIKCAQLPDDRFEETLKNAPGPSVYATFDQCLEIIRKAYHLTAGRPQIVYLVGWQHEGHDDKYPDLSVVNPHLGGRPQLLALIEKAKHYNATVSLHVNCDVAYRDSPGWDPDILCVKAGGGLAEWAVMHNQLNYHISHFKDLSTGSAIRRIDELLDFLPIERTIHYDAFRYTNESWDRDGHIDMTSELVLGVQGMIDRYARDGISLTVESMPANPALVGRIAGSWHSYTHDLFMAMLLHRRWVGGGRNFDDLALGAYLHTNVPGDADGDEIADIYYRGYLLRDLLQRYEMTHARDDGDRLVVRYEKSCLADYDRKRAEFQVVCDGVEVARNDDRFVPLADDKILAYSKQGGPTIRRLPEPWRGKPVAMYRLTESGREAFTGFQVEPAGTIRFISRPRQPYLLTLSESRAAARSRSGR